MGKGTILLCMLCEFVVLVCPSFSGEISPSGALVPDVTSAQEPESVLPPPDRIGNWHRDGDVEIYLPENLYEYIDGAAEGYLDYGFRKLATCRYVQEGTRTNEITVDIYDMGTPLQGFGIYACERVPDDNFIDLGSQGHVSETFLAFWQGKFYVKLIFFGHIKEPDELLLDWGRRISARIRSKSDRPEIFGLFPERHRLKNTEQVFLKAPLGHVFLSPAYQVSYAGKEQPATLLVSVAPEPAEAATRLEKYRENLRKIESTPTLADGFPEGCFRVQDRYLGECVVGRNGRFVVFLLGKAQDPKKIMMELWKNLQTFQQVQSPGETSRG